MEFGSETSQRNPYIQWERFSKNNVPGPNLEY